MKTKIIVGLLTCVALALCLYITPSANAASAEEEVLQVPINWVKAFNSMDFELMSSLYWHSPKTSEFGPTPGRAFLSEDWEQLENKWKSNLKSPKGTYVFNLHNPQVTMLGDNAAVTTGYQTLVVKDPATEEELVIQLRQTLVVQKIDGKWVIAHHHSSVFAVE